MTSARVIPAGAAALLGLVLAACGIFAQQVNEYRNTGIPASRFDSISVIAGSDNQNALQMTRRVREKLDGAGVGIIHVQGLWPTEMAAVEGVCDVYHVSGVVVVEWNRITLRECEQNVVAFDIQGGLSGVDRMADRLLRYLNGR